jgi:thioredoxin 2
MASLTADDRGVIVACPQCKKKNRLPFERLGDTGQCGQCKSELKLTAPVEVGTAAQFDRMSANSPVPILVDFWAPWCGPCRAVAPELEKVAESNAGKYVVIKVNTDALPELGSRHRIGSIPTMAVFRRGKEITRTSGAQPAAAIDTFVRQAAGI